MLDMCLCSLCDPALQGYRSIRATHYVRQGTWFYEATVHVTPPLLHSLPSFLFVE